MSEPPRILLEHRSKTLNLPTFLRQYETLNPTCLTMDRVDSR